MDHLQTLQKLLMTVSFHTNGDLTHMDHCQNKLQKELCQYMYEGLNLQFCK